MFLLDRVTSFLVVFQMQTNSFIGNKVPEIHPRLRNYVSYDVFWDNHVSLLSLKLILQKWQPVWQGKKEEGRSGGAGVYEHICVKIKDVLDKIKKENKQGESNNPQFYTKFRTKSL